MKHPLALLALFAVMTTLLPAAPAIKMGDLRLLRAYAPEDSPVGLRIYLPEGETLAHWNRLASVRVLEDLRDPEEYLLNMAAVATQSHPATRAQILRNDRTKQLILDFVTFSPGAATPAIAEWNLLRAKYVPGTGLVVYQYATRFYQYGAGLGAAINTERSNLSRSFESASFEEQ